MLVMIWVNAVNASSVTYCSGKALSYHEGVFTYSHDNCTLCEICMDVCDSDAIMVKR